MEIQALIELVYWGLIAYGILLGIIFIALVVLMVRFFMKKPGITIKADEVMRPIYRYSNPSRIISKIKRNTNDEH